MAAYHNALREEGSRSDLLQALDDACRQIAEFEKFVRCFPYPHDGEIARRMVVDRANAEADHRWSGVVRDLEQKVAELESRLASGRKMGGGDSDEI